MRSLTRPLLAAVFAICACGSAAPAKTTLPVSLPSPAAPGAIPADSIKISLGGETNGVTVCAGSVWVAVHTESADGVDQIDPATGKTLGLIDRATREARAKVSVEAFYVGTGAGSIWAPSRHDVVRIDPKTAAIVATIHVSPDADLTEVDGDDHAIWATAKEANTIYRIDPATNKVVAKIEGGAYAHGILVQPDAIWISNAHEDTVTRIDPATNETITIAGPGSGVGLAEGGGYVWASTREDLFRIDPATNQATTVVHIGGWPYGIGFLDDVLWVVDGTDAIYGIPIAELLPA